MSKIEDLISPTFFDDMDDAPAGAIPLNACVVVEYIDDNGNKALLCGWSDDMPFYAREGMCRVLLRDATGVPMAAEREEYARRLHEGDQ